MGNKIQRIYIGTQKVRPSWTPGANTIAYYPLTSTTTTSDKSGNGRNLTNYGSISFGTYQGVSCAYNSSGNKKYLYTPTLTGSSIKTISLWTYWTGTWYNSSSDLAPVYTYGANSTATIQLRNRKATGNLNYIWNSNLCARAYISGQWINIVLSIGDSNSTTYINGNVWDTFANGTAVNGVMYLFAFINNLRGIDTYYGGISEVIIENVAWSAADIAKYYKDTKATYGIS